MKLPLIPSVFCLAAVLAMPMASAAIEDDYNWDSTFENGWEYTPEQELEDQEFEQHVKRLCLNQVHDKDLEAKYINEYLEECAAVYGVFDIALL